MENFKLNNIITYKNDLFDIAKSIISQNSQDNNIALTSTQINCFLEESKFINILETILNLKITNDIIYSEKNLNIDNKEEGYDYFNTYQLRTNIGLIITYTSVDIEHEDSIKMFINLIQLDYINTTTNISNIDILLENIKNNLFIKEESNNFYIIGSNSNGLTLKKETITPIEIDIETNYGKDFVKVYENIIHSLTNKTHGLVLMSGAPGSGKTSLIKLIINKLSLKKDIIYVPSFLMNEMGNPDFISFIREQKNSILILEDAEEILVDREEGRNSQAVSNILNMTNGLLNDSLKIQIIATFNMDKKKIDKALLRTGRLIDEWQFGPLKPEEANKVALKLGKIRDYKKSMVLADIYEDCSEDEISKKTNVKRVVKKRVGFNEEDND